MANLCAMRRCTGCAMDIPKEEVMRVYAQLNKIKILFNLGERKTPPEFVSDPHHSTTCRTPAAPAAPAMPASIVYMSDYRTEAPQILRDFLSYHETIKAHSRRTSTNVIYSHTPPILISITHQVFL